ncbi:flagellar motor stator protein MotA [Neptunicoccus cionae]|uniref:flagellar motor stator protein MotA n=1 Tax=Neptunicoccus cionae TaxID=2035344 RepID=UPI000C78C5EA|nr:flagellar motor stator protein MotA [Amylibacter cionae]PLS21146.1 flagellar motor stator protein MotA [Amylibacter cionae]
MLIPIGLLVILLLVFGGFSLSGGNFDVILHALPFEGMMIAGASIGALIVSSDLQSLKLTFGGLKRAFAGPRWKAADYNELLMLLFELARLQRNASPVEMEQHIENPQESDIFTRYPRILKDTSSVMLICDSLRMISLNFDNPHQMEDVIEKRIETTLEERLIGGHAIAKMADGLPAIGIVAAVLGVIKTMSSVDKPPEVLGMMIGGALVGTFLGVFLAYCVVQPVADRIASIEEADYSFAKVIRDTVVAMTQGHPPNVCVEIGRGNIPERLRPSFNNVDESQRNLARAA